MPEREQREHGHGGEAGDGDAGQRVVLGGLAEEVQREADRHGAEDGERAAPALEAFVAVALLS